MCVMSYILWAKFLQIGKSFKLTMVRLTIDRVVPIVPVRHVSSGRKSCLDYQVSRTSDLRLGYELAQRSLLKAAGSRPSARDQSAVKGF